MKPTDRMRQTARAVGERRGAVEGAQNGDGTRECKRTANFLHRGHAATSSAFCSRFFHRAAPLVGFLHQDFKSDLRF
jgi:hypothetical protein